MNRDITSGWGDAVHELTKTFIFGETLSHGKAKEENQMNRQELITDFQRFLDERKEEVKAHLSEPKEEWFDDDGWEAKEKTE